MRRVTNKLAGRGPTRHRVFSFLMVTSLLSVVLVKPPTASCIGPAQAASPVKSVMGAAPLDTQTADPEPVVVVPDQPLREEIVNRTSHTRLVRKPSGEYEFTTSVAPLHWQDSRTKEWKEFQDNLQPADATEAAQGFAYQNKSNGLHIGFGKRAEVVNDRPVLRVATQDGAAVTMTAMGANPSGMSSAGARITYSEAYPGVDLRYTVSGASVKEDAVFKNVPATAAAALLRYDLDLEGVSAARRTDNSVDFVDGSGKAVLRMPRPYMVDSSGVPETGFSDAVAVTLTQLGSGKVRLELVPDLAWLAHPARVLPITVDPTIEAVTYSPDGTIGQDAPIYEAPPWNTVTHGSNAALDVGKRPTDGYSRDSLIQFPALSNLPQDSVVTSATLKLYAPSGTVGLPMQVWRNTEAWDEATVTWANAPAHTTYVWDSVSSTVPGWNSFDVGDLMHHVVSGEYANQGVRIASTGAVGQSVPFVSSDSTDTVHPPQLVVNYVPGTRYGKSDLWSYTRHDHGGGNVSGVNVSTGNLVFKHTGGNAIASGDSDMELLHTYNSMDPYGQTALYDRPGNVWGEGWTFSQNLRLYEAGSPNGVVFKDGSGANHVYAKSGDDGVTRTYLTPRNYGYTLTKDVRSTANPMSVYKLEADSGEMIYYFDDRGKLRKAEDPLSVTHLLYTYDSYGRADTITDETNRRVTLKYLGPGSPGRLSEIVDMSGRRHTYEYDDLGRLIRIKHGVGTTSEKTTTFEYGLANHLTAVTNSSGQRSLIRYGSLYSWDMAGDERGWLADARTTVTQTGSQHTSGSGSLQMNLSDVTATLPGGASHTHTTPLVWNSGQQELIGYVKPESGQVGARLVLEDERGRVVTGPTSVASAGTAWTAIRMPDAHVDPGYKVRRIGVEIRAVSGTYTGAVWLDHVIVKGLTTSWTNSQPTPSTVGDVRYDWTLDKTTVSGQGGDGTSSTVAYTYDGSGSTTAVTVNPIPGCI